MSHGAIKLWLIVGLLRERLWYCPTAIAVFGLFIVYQLHRVSFTHSAFLLFLTALDVLVIVLTWHDYGYVRRQLQQQTKGAGTDMFDPKATASHLDSTTPGAEHPFRPLRGAPGR